MNQRLAFDHTITENDRIGFFGKLPTHGDFVATGLSRPVQEAFDAWLQSGLGKAQHHAGERWEQIFRRMPAWRFIIDRGLWGPATIAGVIVPSRDRVGRSFPLVIAAQLHDFAGDARKLCLDDTWFVALEGMAETSARRDFEIDTFTANLKRLRSLRPGDFDFTDRKPASTHRPDTFWWRFDPEDRRTKGFRSGGAPQPSDFPELMMAGMPAGEPQPEPDQAAAPAPKNARQQSASPAEPLPSNVAAIQPDILREPVAVPMPAAAPVASRADFRLPYSKASHAGTRLSINADAVLTQDEPCLFAIADGIGDGTAAVEAARVTVATLGETSAQQTLENLVQEVKGKLGRAHGLLQSMAGVQDRQPPSASLVSLAAVDGRFALIWAGDARGYLLRDGMMRCLTRDHVAVGLHRTLSRGIGVAGQLTPEVISARLQHGDRFLLCSHPLTRAVPERTIAEILIALELNDVANALIQEALIANCRENISAIIIDVKDSDVG